MTSKVKSSLSFEPQTIGSSFRQRTHNESRLVPTIRPWWLSEEEWPFPTYRLEVDGSGIAVTEVGSGPVLLFVHSGFWSFIWRDLIRLLSSDFRCVCFDSPGTGLSDRLNTKSVSLAGASRVVTTVIESLDLNDLTLVIHDLGGPVTIAGAAELSQRVAGIVAVNSFAWKPEDRRLRAMLTVVGSSLARELDVATGLVPRITASKFGMGLRMDASGLQTFKSGIGSDGLRAFHKYMSDARQSDNVYKRSEAALNGPFRHLPLLTIFGEHNDPFHFQQRWKELFPVARQLVISQGNHFPMCDAPEFVAGAIRRWHGESVGQEFVLQTMPWEEEDEIYTR